MSTVETATQNRVWQFLLVAVYCITCFGTLANAQQSETLKIRGDRLTGIVLPVEPIEGDITITALRANGWKVADTNRLYLEGDTTIRIGTFEFDSDDAVVWLNRLESADGLINQIAIYFNHLEEPTGRAGIAAQGEKLLVTGSAIGNVTLDVALLDDSRPIRSPFINQAEQRLAAHLQTLFTEPLPELAQYPQIDFPLEKPDPQGPRDFQVLNDTSQLPIFSNDTKINVSAGKLEVQSGELENVIIATHGLIVESADDVTKQRLTLSSERGVVYTKPGPLSELPSVAMDADFVQGIYLEGNVVASDGDYTVRSNRAFYDVQRQEAILLDGVLRTYSRTVNRTVYARADEFRQISKSQWQANKAIVSTSSFATPHLALGASQVRITQAPESTTDTNPDTPDDLLETRFDSRGNTVRAGGIPVLYWPRFKGTVSSIPLEDIEGGYTESDGVFVRTLWDLYSLLGIERDDDTALRLAFDVFSRRAVATGIEFEYDYADDIGFLELYGMYDTGTDRTSSGQDVEQDDEFRGVVLWEHQTFLSPEMTLQLQASYISDPSFITTWREDDFAERREYETSAYLRHLDAHTAWTLLASYDLNDFVSNDYILASRAYQVEKVPEATYRRYGDSIFNDRVTYSSEYRLSRARLSFEKSTSRELGIRQSVFGIGLDNPIDNLLQSSGLSSQFVSRFDTRHELSLPTKVGIFRVNPFIVGRVTAYDDDFEDFSGEDDQTRFFGAAGVKVSSTFQRVHNDANNAMFDIHRLRHVVEPSVTVWFGHSTIDQKNLPVYDEEVESLADGLAVRFGLKQSWQTQRGGPGRWRSVDFLTLDAALIMTSGETDREYPTPRFYEYRPEYSVLEDHVFTRAVWLPSDSLSVVAEATYDLNESRVARGTFGVQLQHSPLFSTFVEYRYIDASDNELLEVRWAYQLTRKYGIELSPQWDFQEDEFRSVRTTVVRSFPDFDLLFALDVDKIRDETTFAIALRLSEF